MRYEIIAAGRVMADANARAKAEKLADELVDSPHQPSPPVEVKIWDRTDRKWLTMDHAKTRQAPMGGT